MDSGRPLEALAAPVYTPPVSAPAPVTMTPSAPITPTSTYSSLPNWVGILVLVVFALIVIGVLLWLAIPPPTPIPNSITVAPPSNIQASEPQSMGSMVEVEVTWSPPNPIPNYYILFYGTAPTANITRMIGNVRVPGDRTRYVLNIVPLVYGPYWIRMESILNGASSTLSSPSNEFVIRRNDTSNVYLSNPTHNVLITNEQDEAIACPVNDRSNFTYDLNTTSGGTRIRQTDTGNLLAYDPDNDRMVMTRETSGLETLFEYHHSQRRLYLASDPRRCVAVGWDSAELSLSENFEDIHGRPKISRSASADDSGSFKRHSTFDAPSRSSVMTPSVSEVRQKSRSRSDSRFEALTPESSPRRALALASKSHTATELPPSKTASHVDRSVSKYSEQGSVVASGTCRSISSEPSRIDTRSITSNRSSSTVSTSRRDSSCTDTITRSCDTRCDSERRCMRLVLREVDLGDPNQEWVISTLLR